MPRWPNHEIAVSRRAALWLLGACAVLWTLDVLIQEFPNHPWVRQLQLVPGWLDLPRMILPYGGLLILFVTRRVRPAEVGFTLGSAGATFFWCFVPLLGVLLGILFAALALGSLLYITGWKLPGQWLEPTAVHSLADWRAHWLRHLMWWCADAPLLEEPLYRAMPYAALLPFVGKRGAILGVAIVWSALHFYYGWPAWMIPYYFIWWGICVTWFYSNSQSLITTMLLHGFLNFIGPLLADVVILTQRDWLKQFFDLK